MTIRNVKNPQQLQEKIDELKSEPLPVRSESAGWVCGWKKESFCMYFGNGKACNYAGGCPHKSNRVISGKVSTYNRIKGR